jgi:hypothetical protein
MIQLARTQAKRKLISGKESAFRVNKKPVKQQKTRRYLKGNNISESELLSVARTCDGNIILPTQVKSQIDLIIALLPTFSVYIPGPPSPQTGRNPLSADSNISEDSARFKRLTVSTDARREEILSQRGRYQMI